MELMMERRAFMIHIRPGMEEEYKERHRRVWPEVLEALGRCGVRDYSIFQQGTLLFAYMETEGDFQPAFERLHAEPASRRWREYMSDIIIRNDQMGFHFLEEVFHLD
jgi:L-rhamnose mutarotase